METSLQNILPDAFSGALFALEGIKDSVVVLNGPTGCKFYHAAVSGDQLCRGFSYDPVTNPERYYFRQNRIPCTFLDDHDFVYGAREKLEGVLQFIKDEQFHYLAIVNSPGAALIGDDLESFFRNAHPGMPGITIENTGFSAPFHVGFSETLLQVLKSLRPQQKSLTEKKTVNLVGISIYHKYFEGDVLEMKRLLGLCGISVKTTMLAGDSTEQLSRFAEAELNVVLQPEFGKAAAQWMEQEFGIPYLEQETGMCIGFDATERLILSVCKQLGCDPQPAIEDIKRARARAFANLYSFNSLTGLPKGAYFSIRAEASFAYSLCHFLYSYLGMLPEKIELIDVLPDDHWQNKLNDFLICKGLGERLGSVKKLEVSSVLLADANCIAQAQLNNKDLFGIEISLPGFGYTHVVPKTLVGVKGCLYLLEQLINGMKFVK
ncbi:MAG: nitrogenase component 1 [Marinifilaceae bacterium]